MKIRPILKGYLKESENQSMQNICALGTINSQSPLALISYAFATSINWQSFLEDNLAVSIKMSVYFGSTVALCI